MSEGVNNFLEQFGLDIQQLSDEDVREYFHVVGLAFGIYARKETIRRGLWKEHTALDQAKQIKIKIERIINVLEREKLTPEERDYLFEEFGDIGNYTVFAHRLVQGVEL